MKSNTFINPFCIVILSLLLLYILYKILFIKRVRVTIPSLIYASSADNFGLHNQETMIHIQGEIHSQLIGESYFTGTIWVDNYKPCMTQPTQVRFPIEENNMFFYSFRAEQGDHYCYVYLDDIRNEVALLFPGGIHVAGPATNSEELKNVLNKSWGYQKVDYEAHTLSDFIYANQEFCFGALKLNRTNRNDTIKLNTNSILKSTTNTVNRFELRYQRYLYFKDVKIAADNVQFNFEEDLLKEISILLSYKNDEQYQQTLTNLKETLAAFPKIRISESSYNTYYKDETRKLLHLEESPVNRTIQLRIYEH